MKVNKIDSDVYHVQNPAIGAAILWKFTQGYYAKNSYPVPFPLLFIVLPIIFREDLCTVIKSTQKGKGISKVSQKLFDTKKKDNLYAVNNSAIVLRELTLESFNMGVAAKLMAMDKSTAMVYPILEKGRNMESDSVSTLLNAAEKLGGWCAELTLLEICDWLKVRF